MDNVIFVDYNGSRLKIWKNKDGYYESEKVNPPEVERDKGLDYRHSKSPVKISVCDGSPMCIGIAETDENNVVVFLCNEKGEAFSGGTLFDMNRNGVFANKYLEQSISPFPYNKNGLYIA